MLTTCLVGFCNLFAFKFCLLSDLHRFVVSQKENTPELYLLSLSFGIFSILSAGT